MKKTRLLSIVFCCCCVFVRKNAIAQDPYYINYSVNDGLPSSEAYCVMQDKKGYIWMSCDAGVARFNGNTFETYTTHEGLTDNTVFGLHEDKRGRIWCRTLSGRICYFENGKIHGVTANDSLALLTGSNSMTGLDVDHKGVVYVSHLNSKKITSIKPPYREADIGAVYSGSEEICMLAKFGNSYLNTSAFKLEKILIRDEKGQHIVRTKSPKATWGDEHIRNYTKGDHFYVSSGNEILHFYKYDFVESHKVNALVTALFVDDTGNLWAGTLEHGIYVFKDGWLQRNKPLHFFRRESVTHIIQDNEGGFWITSLKNGVFYLPYPRVWQYREMSLLDDNKVYTVTGYKNEILAGKSNGEMLVIDRHGRLDTTIRWICIGLLKNQPNSILNIKVVGRDSVMVMGSQTFLYNPGSRKKIISYRYRHLTRGIINFFSKDIERYGKDFCGTGSTSIFFLDRGSDLTKSNNTLFSARVNTVCCNGEAIWVGTAEGLWRLKESVFYNYGDSVPALKNRVDDIQVVQDELVLATKTTGLILWNDKTKEVRGINTLHGLSSNNCRHIFVENDSIVWISTNKGLNKVNISNKKVLFTYTTEHGLPSNEITCSYITKDKIWVATTHGLCCVDKKQSFVNTTRPEIRITGIRVMGRDTVLQDGIELRYDQRQVAFSFTGNISYRTKGKWRYKYRLAGLNDRWRITNVPVIEFSSLSPGQYTFEVLAVNNSGLPSIKPVRFSFVVLTPLWQTTWFIVLSALTMVVLLYYLFRGRLKRIRREEARNAELNRALLALKLKALRAQMNPHFTFNVMNSIQHFILEKDEESAHRYLSKFSKLIRIILQHSEEEMVPVAEEVKALELYLDLEAMRFENSFSYEIVVDHTLDAGKTMIPSMLLQPYVENAVKHGIQPMNKPGIIRILILDEGTELKCIIEDNGIGRQKAAELMASREHRSFGTYITQERLSVINQINKVQLSEKTIDLKDHKGNATGTRVEIYLPKTEETI